MPLRSAEQAWTAHVPGSRRVGVRLLLADMAAAVLLAGLVAFVLRDSHEAYEARALSTAEGLAAVLADDVSADIARLDNVLSTLGEDVVLLRAAGQDDESHLAALLARHRARIPQADGLRLTDADGHVRMSADGPPSVGLDLADRDYFLRARDDPHAGLIVSKPLVGRITGHPGFVVARRVNRPDGSFGGVVFALLTSEHLGRALSVPALGPDDAAGLRTADLKLVARSGRGGSMLDGTELGASPEFSRAYAADRTSGHFKSESLVDHVPRIAAYHAVPSAPLVVVVGLGIDRFFAPWRRDAFIVAGLSLGLMALVVGATVTVYRAWRREISLGRRLVTEARRVQALVRSASDGLHVLDRTGHVVEASDAFAEMLGTTREALLGRHVTSWDVRQDAEAIDRWLSGLRDGDRQRVEVRHRRSDGGELDIDLHLRVLMLDGELYVYCSARDVSERKRLQSTLAESAARMQDLYDHAPCGYHSLDEDGVFVHVNATLAEWLGATPESLVGRARIADFLAEPGREVFESLFPQMKAGATLHNVEVELVSRTGTRRRVRADVVPVCTREGRFRYSRTVLHDVTASWTAQQEVARLLRDQTAMLESDLVAMARLRDRRVVWHNLALVRLFGYEEEDLTGQSSRLLYADDGAFATLGAAAYPALTQGLHYRTTVQMKRQDGQLLWIDLSGVALSDGSSLWMMVDVTPQRQRQDEVERLAFHDPLTGLPNRVLVADRLHQAILAAERSGRGVGVCYLDLDGFKEVNDAHGHAAGDTLLREVAHRLRCGIRANDTAARMGGDEFVLVLTHLETAGECLEILERLLRALAGEIPLREGLGVHVSASFGVALFPAHGADVPALLAAADHAMLAAKRAGKDRIVVSGEE